MTRDKLLSTLERAHAVELIAIEDTDRNPIQAPQREEMGIKDLCLDITKTGFIQPILVTRKRTRYTMIDGHRRREAAKRLGLSRIPAVVMDSNMSITLLFLHMNKSSKAVNAAQMFYAWAHEQPEDQEQFLRDISKATQRNIRLMVQIFGVSYCIRKADGKLSPHIAKFVNDVSNLFVHHQIDPLPVKQIGEWVIKHTATNLVNRLRRDPSRKKAQVDKLRAAIVADRPFEKKVRKSTSTRQAA